MVKSIEIPYDKEIYFAMTSTEKFSKCPDLKKLSISECLENGINIQQVGETLIFRSKWTFDTRDLEKILKVHTPTEANSWYDNCKNNILTVQFYKI